MKRYVECRVASGEWQVEEPADGGGAFGVLVAAGRLGVWSSAFTRSAGRRASDRVNADLRTVETPRHFGGAAGFAGLLCRPGGQGVIHRSINGERSVVTFVTFGFSREKGGVFCKSLADSGFGFCSFVSTARSEIVQNTACQPARRHANLRSDSAEPTSGCVMELPDFEMPSASDLVHMAVLYMIAGCVLGFVEFTIAKAVFKGQPREAMLTRKVFALCLVVNAVAWPGVLVWLALAGLLKGTMLYLEKKKR